MSSLSSSASMTICIAILTLFTGPALASPERFESLEQAPQNGPLLFRSTSGQQFEAPRLQDQVGFQSPQISPDGRYVGWLALYPNCCTSYPIPLTLVVMDLNRQIHEFDGIQLPTFRWCFLMNSTSVAYMQTQVHGTNFEHFERRALMDGRLLAEYEYPHEEPEHTESRKRAPAWVKCASN